MCSGAKERAILLLRMRLISQRFNVANKETDWPASTMCHRLFEPLNKFSTTLGHEQELTVEFEGG